MNAIKQKGFTLLELLIVTAIIGTLAAIALPSYLSYTLRAKTIEGLTISSVAMTKITRYYQYTGEFPKDNLAAGLNAPDEIKGKYVKSLTVDNGAIHVQFSNMEPALANQFFSMRPVITKDALTAPIHFICGYAKVKNKQQVAIGKNKTNIALKLLVSSCR